MKKIMFNDRYGLTAAVLKGRKPLTRRIVTDYEKAKKQWDDMCRLGTPCYSSFEDFLIKRVAKYKVGEVVAVAQSYETLANSGFLDKMMETSSTFKKEYCGAGWSNKMFVRADLMPNRIRFTDNKVERLQDISDEDCLMEGISWDYADYPYMEKKVYGFKGYEGFQTPRLAFAALTNRINGKSTWEINPWVFAYSFELVK